jgi:hypothetical protein
MSDQGHLRKLTPVEQRTLRSEAILDAEAFKASLVLQLGKALAEKHMNEIDDLYEEFRPKFEAASDAPDKEDRLEALLEELVKRIDDLGNL